MSNSRGRGRSASAKDTASYSRRRAPGSTKRCRLASVSSLFFDIVDTVAQSSCLAGAACHAAGQFVWVWWMVIPSILAIGLSVLTVSGVEMPKCRDPGGRVSHGLEVGLAELPPSPRLVQIWLFELRHHLVDLSVCSKRTRMLGSVTACPPQPPPARSPADNARPPTAGSRPATRGPPGCSDRASC